MLHETVVRAAVAVPGLGNNLAPDFFPIAMVLVVVVVVVAAVEEEVVDIMIAVFGQVLPVYSLKIVLEE